MGEAWEPMSQRYRVLLSLREEFLGGLAEWEHEIPSILSNWMRILPMSGARALRAIRSVAPHLLSEPAAVSIIHRLALRNPNEPEASESLDKLAVDPAVLSIVCAQLDRRRKALGLLEIDEGLLKTLPAEQCLTDYYQYAVADVPAPTRRFIQDKLVTASGIRTSYPLADALQVREVRQQDIHRLIDRHVLVISLHAGTEWLGLSHDLLVFSVMRSREEARKKWWHLFRQ